MTWLRIEAVISHKQSRLFTLSIKEAAFALTQSHKDLTVYAVKATCILNLSLEWK
jgi:hypothetical protein